jgi:parallel beta-helix repeat protein
MQLRNKSVTALLFITAFLIAGISSFGTAGATPTCTTGFNVPANYSTIQAAINAATSGQTICVSSATYAEQLSFTSANTGVTLYAPSGATVAPTSLSSVGTDPDNGLPNAPVVYVNDVTGVTIEGFTIDGSATATSVASTYACAVNFEGILFLDASGTVTGNTVTNILEQPIASYGGCQTGLAINVESGTSGTSTVTVSNNIVSNYQKNGITCDDSGTTCAVSDNTVSPDAANTAYIAPNGIQIGPGASGSVTGNTVTGNVCNLASACSGAFSDYDFTQSCGILTYQSVPTTTINDNTINGNDIGICLYQDTGTLSPTGNSLSNNRYAAIEVGDESQTVSGNSISFSPYGIVALSDSTGYPATVTYSDGFTSVSQDCTTVQTESSATLVSASTSYYTTYTGSAACISTTSTTSAPGVPQFNPIFGIGFVTAISLLGLVLLRARNRPTAVLS